MLEDYSIDPKAQRHLRGFRFRKKTPASPDTGNFYSSRNDGSFGASRSVGGGYTLINSDPNVSLQCDIFKVLRDSTLFDLGIGANQAFHQTIRGGNNSWATQAMQTQWGGNFTVTAHQDIHELTTLSGETHALRGDWTYEIEDDTGMIKQRITPPPAWSQGGFVKDPISLIGEDGPEFLL